MKKGIIFFSFFILIISNTFAQDLFRQNTISIGGDISFSSKTPEDGSTTTVLNVRPQFDYFIIDNLSLGLIVNIENTVRSGITHSIIGFGPGGRYYFQTGSINPFIGLGYLYSKDKWFARGDKFTELTETQLIIDAGLELFISGSLAIEPVISYKFINEKNDENDFMFYYLSPIGYNEGNSKVIEIGLGLKYFLN